MSQVKRFLVVYNGQSEELESLFPLTAFPVEQFAEQFGADLAHDPEMYDCYAVGPGDTAFLRSFLESEPEYDFSKYAYFVEAVEDR